MDFPEIKYIQKYGSTFNLFSPFVKFLKLLMNYSSHIFNVIINQEFQFVIAKEKSVLKFKLPTA